MQLVQSHKKSKNVSFRCVIEMQNLFFTAVEFEKQDNVKKTDVYV